MTQNLNKIITRYCNHHALAQLAPELRLETTSSQFGVVGSTPQHNPNAKSNMQLEKQTSKTQDFNSKSKFGFKKQMTVALPEFDRLGNDDDSQWHSQYLILPEY